MASNIQKYLMRYSVPELSSFQFVYSKHNLIQPGLVDQVDWLVVVRS